MAEETDRRIPGVDQENSTSSGGVRSVHRALSVLEALIGRDGEATLTELSFSSGLPAPTVHRLIRTLVDLGYVQQGEHRRYSLGMQLIRLGESACVQFRRRIRPSLARLVAEVGGTASLTVLDKHEVVCIAQACGKAPPYSNVGLRFPLHTSGAAKAILSQLPVERARELLVHVGGQVTSTRTWSDIDDLLAEIAEVAVRGFVMYDNGNEPGIHHLAVPVPCAPTPSALLLSTRTAGLTPTQIREIVPAVRYAAGQLSGHVSDR